MTKEALQEILHVLELDYEAEPTLVYVFYTTPDGRVNNFSISVRKGGTLSREKLEKLMRSEYPSTREGKVLSVEKPEPSSAVEWLEVNEVCRLLRISQKTLRRWTQRGYFHPSQIGQRIYYMREEIETVLRANAVMDNHRFDATAMSPGDK